MPIGDIKNQQEIFISGYHASKLEAQAVALCESDTDCAVEDIKVCTESPCFRSTREALDAATITPSSALCRTIRQKQMCRT